MSTSTQAPPPPSSPSLPGSVWFSRFGLPILVFAGAAYLLFLVFGDSLQPGVKVSVSPVLLLPIPPEFQQDSSTSNPSSKATAITQAAGWVEAAPYPLHVSPQITGLVQEVFALEGQSVNAGELLVTLDPADLQHQVDLLEAKIKARTQALSSDQANIEAGKADIQKAEARLKIREARFEETHDFLARLRSLKEEDRSASELQTALSQQTAQQADVMLAKAILREETALATGRIATFSESQAELEALKVELSLAQLNLSRTKIHAPANGIILARNAEPGLWTRPGADPLFTLYRPGNLQVRVDVPLVDAGKIAAGMPVRLSSSMLQGHPFYGTVSQITGKADLTRNTLQVKVVLTDPPPSLRPEMLCRAEFIASETSSSEPSEAYGSWIPDASLLSPSDQSGSVWVVSPDSDTIQRQEVQLAGFQKDGYHLLTEGPGPGQLLVLNPPLTLQNGNRVTFNQEQP